MIDKIKKFTVDDKNNLLSKTFYVLPDNPSDKHFSPSQIRKKGYEGYLVLFEFLNSVIDAINDNVDLSNEDIEAINADIATIQSYFSNGIALHAIADKNGDDIVATYETKADASNKLTNAMLYANGKVLNEATARESADAGLEARKVNVADVVDNLTDTSTTKPLSAYMGKVLKDMIDTIASILASDDTDLDTLQEIVAYVKDNKSLIDSITVAKVNVSDIIDNLTSEIANKPVSAKQAFILKGMIDDTNALKADAEDVYDKNEIDAKIHGMLFADIDEDFDLESENPVQNQVISKKIKDIDYKIMVMKGELFETILSEIDYKVDFATLFAIPDTLSDDDGTHRLVYSDTQLKEVEGNSVAWNQLCEDNFRDTTSYWARNRVTQTNNNNIATIVSNSNAYNQVSIYHPFTPGQLVKGNKYLVRIKVKLTSGLCTDFRLFMQNDSTIVRNPQLNVWYDLCFIWTNTRENNQSVNGFVTQRTYNTVDDVVVNSDSFEAKEPQIFDLTLMFGAGNEPTSVEEFTRLFPKPYYEYNAGEIRTTVIKGVKVNGYNLLNLNRVQGDLGNFDATSQRTFKENEYYLGLTANNYYSPVNVSNFSKTNNSITFTTNSTAYGIGFPIKVVGGKTYIIEHTASDNTSTKYMSWYDENGNFISFQSGIGTFTAPNNAYWGVAIIRPTNSTDSVTYTNICVHFAGSRAGWASYKEPHIIQIPETELLSAGSVHDTIKFVEGNIVAGVQRYNMVHVSRVGDVDLGTLTWVSGNSYGETSADNLGGIIKPIANGNVVLNGICSIFECTSANQLYHSETKDKVIAQWQSTVATGGRITIKYADFISKTPTEIQTALSGVYLCYEKNEYTETTLATDLTFEEVSAIIEQNGSIEALFENVPPNIKTAFVVKKAITEGE